MSYDLYVNYPCDDEDKIKDIVKNAGLDIPTRIALLAGALPKNTKEKARMGGRQHGGYKSLIFEIDSAQTPYTRETITNEKQRLERLEIWRPALPDFTVLPLYSTFLQFQFTLASPYMSRDDEIFHICDNPVRKEKVFKVPLMAGSAWKGNLRWTATRLMVFQWEKEHDVAKLAESRFRLALLFGDEKGEGENQGLAHYLDNLEPEEEAKEAVRLYREKLCQYFSISDGIVPNYAGCLYCYPTFFDRISLEVINPHNRMTRAGKQPIYFESVPVGATGIFSLLYIPWNGVTEAEAQMDLTLVLEAVCEMMLIYGFSAKKSSGFGEAEDEVKGQITTIADQKLIMRLSTLKEVAKHVQWK